MRKTRTALRYTLAVLVALVGIALRYLLLPLFGVRHPYHTVWVAVVFSAWYLGLGPSILTTVLVALGVSYWLPPDQSFAIQDPIDLWGMLGFLVFSTVIIALGESNRRGIAARSKLAAIVESSHDAIISKNLDGVITSWNKSAARLFGYTSEEAIGRKIAMLIPEVRCQEELSIMDRLGRGERVEPFQTVRTHKDGSDIDVSLTISPVKDAAGHVLGASTVARDITQQLQAERALRESEERFRQLAESLDSQVRDRTSALEERNREVLRQSEELRALSFRLLKAQDDERRYLARELHDSAGQTLAMLGMNLSEIVEQAKRYDSQLAKCGEETQELVRQLTSDVRTTSYLLHPPLLDESGLSAALGLYIDGLEKRSGLQIQLTISKDFGRLPDDMELIVFRLVQECLTNVHRHSGSKVATIRVNRAAEDISVEIQDQGHGMSTERLAEIQTHGSGVGIRGMLERLRQFRGELNICSDASGTRISATIPISKRATSGEPANTRSFGATH